jgi:hypothetical protein
MNYTQNLHLAPLATLGAVTLSLAADIAGGALMLACSCGATSSTPRWRSSRRAASRARSRCQARFAESDPIVLDIAASTSETAAGIDRWETWSPFSDFIGLEPGVNVVTALASNWTAGIYQIGITWQDAYR